MNTRTIPILCGAALAIMAGAGASHYHSVEQLVALSGLAPTPAANPTAPGEDRRQMLAAIHEIGRQNASLQQALDSEQSGPVAAPSGSDAPYLRQVLAELVEQNKYLRDQVAETNRDMMELQFRVDTHSEQFRPLKISEEITYDDSIGVLPPREVP